MARLINYMIAGVVLAVAGCRPAEKEYEMGSYGYDAKFFRDHKIEFLELTAPEGGAKVLVAPGYQGRVMTTTADGDGGDSYGWINYRFIESGERNPQFNPVGGEERFWIGPEGGAFSYYFRPGAEQVYANWLVPAVIDTERYDVAEQSAVRVRFTKSAKLLNASGVSFDMGIERTMASIRRARIVIRLTDATAPEPPEQFALRPDQTLLRVVNKLDLRPDAPLPEGAVGLSARNGEGIDRLCRIAAYTRSSVFHFYKDKVFSVSCNQIDLSQPAAIIICHDLVSQRFKISTCFPFIAGACPAIILLIHNYV